MKKTVTYVVAALFACLISGGAAAKTLKFATLAPAGTTWMNEMKAGADKVKERTGGRVKLKFYPGGVMGNDQSVHRKIKIGQLHGGAFTQGGLASVDSSVVAIGLPMMFKNLDEVDYVRQRIEPELKASMEQGGYVLLGVSEGGFARILSKQPMIDVKALRDSKVWVPEGDQVSLTAYRALGVTPISLPISDVFTGLQTGLIETVAANPTAAIAFQWHSSTEYMTDVPITFLTGLLAVSKKVFDKLSAEDQAVLREEMGTVFKRLDALNRSDNEAARAALQQQGIKFVTPSPEEVARWREIGSQSVDDMVANGVISGDVVERVRTLLQEYRAQQQ